MKNNTVVNNKVITNMFPRYYINNRNVTQSEYVYACLIAGNKFRIIRDKYRVFLYIGD